MLSLLEGEVEDFSLSKFEGHVEVIFSKCSGTTEIFNFWIVLSCFNAGQGLRLEMTSRMLLRGFSSQGFLGKVLMTVCSYVDGILQYPS